MKKVKDTLIFLSKRLFFEKRGVFAQKKFFSRVFSKKSKNRPKDKEKSEKTQKNFFSRVFSKKCQKVPKSAKKCRKMPKNAKILKNPGKKNFGACMGFLYIKTAFVRKTGLDG
jgi:hypothetical protein